MAHLLLTPTVNIETPRLLLRQFDESDFDSYAEICADPVVMRYIGDGKPLTRSEAWRNMAMMTGHWLLRGYGTWAVEERESGAMIGRIGFWYPDGWPDFELGWLLSRRCWGHGYATEAAAQALDYAFSRLDRTHVISLILPENVRSIRVAQKLGETHHGNIDVSGREALVYRIDRDQWNRCEKWRSSLKI